MACVARVSGFIVGVVSLAACGDDGTRQDSISGSVSSPSASTAPTTATESGGSTAMPTSGVTGSASADGTDTATDPGGVTGGPCMAGRRVCDGGAAKVCDGMGGYTGETPCPVQCAEGLGCVACVPGTVQCAGAVVQACATDGSAWVDQRTCDPLLGLTCDAGGATCTGACASLGLSYIGCDYAPVMLLQVDGYGGDYNPFAVAVANTTTQAATLTFTRGDMPIVSDSVPANSVKIVELPVVDAVAKGLGPSALVPDGAYRLRSDQPVTVYQYNPLNADVTNDASLLLPANVWTGNYVAASWWNYDEFYPGWVAVTAREDGTTVTMAAPKGGVPTLAGGGIDAGGNGVVVMNAGDVLQVVTDMGGDLTGMHVTADKPVQVFGGHKCAHVPREFGACDHLEEAMFPIEALAREYMVVPPVQVPNNELEKAVVVRVLAAEPDVTLTFDPDQPVAKTLAAIGDFVEIPMTTEHIHVKADRKILVVEYMVGQEAGYGTSDPDMLLAVPSAQYRDNYLFYAHTAWLANFVDIVAPVGAAVLVDGVGVAGFNPIGATGFSLAHVKLANETGGTHVVTADQKVGISVYGVVDYGSYWYPGGLDLTVIPPQ